jgi:hypothetical protein
MKSAAKFSTHRFLIVGGTSKAGTTSVFNYLAGHPQICPAEKETRFFLDADYPLPSNKRYEKNGPETYLSLFDSGPQENWRFEATPDYLYSPNTASVIHQTLPNVRFVFILREPISRLLSWYRFGRAMSETPLNMTFDEYVAVQREQRDIRQAGIRHPAFYALQHGRYSVYLRPYLDLFGRSSIHIRFYEELRRDPLTFMVSICRSVGINETYFRGYRFDIANKGVNVRSRYLRRGYCKSKQHVRRLARHTPKLGLFLRRIRSRVDAAYEKLNIIRDENLTMSCSTRDFVLSYYKDESARLKEMLGVEVPWPSTCQAGTAGNEGPYSARIEQL